MIDHHKNHENFRKENGVPSYGGRINGHNGQLICGCYPECRYDCPDSMKCYESMPEYWTKEYRAQRYASEVRERNPMVRQWIEKITNRKLS